MCAFLLGATWPTLAALPGVPSRILAGDAYVVTQGSGVASINASLARNLTVQPWAEIVSPEILSLGTVVGEPVVVRAAEPTAFLSLEGGAWVQPANLSDRWAVAGEGLARRIRVAPGDSLTVVGSATPRIAFVRIAGIYRTGTPSNDELLVDVTTGRFLAALGPTGYLSIRVKTGDPPALVAFLRGFGASVHVTGPGLPPADIASEPPTNERLANLILRTGTGGTPRDYLATAVSEATTSVRVVAYGIAALLAILVAFGIHAVQTRAFADRLPVVGVLRALGAGNRWLRRRLLRESVPLAVLAAVIAAGFGYAVETIGQPGASLVVFGHEVLISFDIATFALIVLAVVAISSASGLALLQGAMRSRPTESIRETPAVEPPQSLEVVLRG